MKVRAFPSVTTVTSQKPSSARPFRSDDFSHLFGVLGFQQQALRLCGCGLSLPSCVAWLTGATEPPPSLSYPLLSSLSFLCFFGGERGATSPSLGSGEFTSEGSGEFTSESTGWP